MECRPRGRQPGETSVFQRLGSRTRHDDRVRRPSRDGLDLEEEDKYHHPRWCPDRLSRLQKRRVQRLRNLEEAEAKYLDVLKKARPDLVEQVRRPQMVEKRPPRREWRPKQPRADDKPSTDVNMVFVLSSEFRAPQLEGLAIAQLDLGPQPTPSFWKNTSISTSCAADMNRKRMSTSTAQGGRWGDARLYTTSGIARSSGTVGIPA